VCVCVCGACLGSLLLLRTVLEEKRKACARTARQREEESCHHLLSSAVSVAQVDAASLLSLSHASLDQCVLCVFITLRMSCVSLVSLYHLCLPITG
jgi:hypothetical protein